MYLAQKNPTDVISFDLSGNKDEVLADIVVSADAAIRNARAFETTPVYELYLYVVHGVLHLLGYNDTTAKEKNTMKRRAGQILECLSIRAKQ